MSNESDSTPPRICRNCGRISDSDFKRKYCPVTAQVICACRIAESCKFFLPKKDRNGQKG